MGARRWAQPAALVPGLVLALGISACARPVENPDPGADAAAAARPTGEAPGFLLPAGAEYQPPGSNPADPVETERVVATYRPDDATPAERVPGIVERGRLIVGVDQSNNLLSYRDMATGQLRGFEIDLAREIARDIFGDPDRVDFRFVTSAERIEALNSGTVDMVIRSMTVTAQRQEKVEFSLPYFLAHTRMLVVKDSGIDEVEDLNGRTACSSTVTTSLERIRAQAPGAGILATRSWGDCLLALQLGQVDAVVTDDALLSGMQDQDPYTEIVGAPLSEELYAVAVRKPDAGHDTRGLVRQVNDTLLRMRADGTWQRLFDQWFGAYLTMPQLPAPAFRDEAAGDTDSETEE